MELSTHSMATPLSAKTAIHMDAYPVSPSAMTKALTASANITFCQAMRVVTFAMEMD